MKRFWATLLVVTVATVPIEAIPVRADRVASVARRSDQASVPFPSHPWSGMRRVELPSPCATPAVTLPDGGLAVGLEAPPGVAFLHPDGVHVTVARLERRITQPLTVGRDGRVWVVADRFVFTFAPDGTVRSSVELLGRVEGPVMVRSDGSAVVVGGATRTSVEYTLLSSTGDPVGVRAPGAIMTFERAHLADDRIAATDGRALVFLDLRGELTRTATLPNLRHLAPLGAGLAMSTERSLFVADANGVVSSQLTLPDAPLWLAPLGSHRLGVALPGSLPQLWIIDHHGVVTARVRVPPSTSSPLVDPTGAVLLASRAGTVVCLAPDGNERWRLTTTDVLRPPAAPLPRGGVAFATEGTSLLLFTEGP